MKDSINSWINEEEVRKLAEDLSASPETVKEWRANDFDGFAIPEKQGQVINRGKEVEEDLSEEVKANTALSLAGASAMAASAGLLSSVKTVSESVVLKDVASEKPLGLTNLSQNGAELCDHSLHAIPVNLAEGVSRELPRVNPAKELGTFEEIDRQLSKTVNGKGICVIDRDGDVLYSSMVNKNLVAFTVDTMMGTSLTGIDDGQFENIRIKLSSGNYLEFISVKSTRGVLVLSTLVNHVLSGENVKLVAADVLKIANSH